MNPNAINQKVYNFKFNIVPQGNVEFKYFPGHIVHSIFLKAISIIDKAYAKWLHDVKAIKPFSVKPFFKLKPQGRIQIVQRLETGVNYYFEVSIFDRKLKEIFFQALREVIRRGYIVIRNTKAILQGIEYSEVSIKPRKISDKDLIQVRVKFITPTRFPVKKSIRLRKAKFRLMPIPESLVFNLVHHWNYFVDVNSRIDEKEIVEYTLNFAYENKFNLKTVKVDIDKERFFIGSVGVAEYIFLNPKEYDEKYLKYYEYITLLLEYAKYSNVGASKPLGFGVVEVEIL